MQLLEEFVTNCSFVNLHVVLQCEVHVASEVLITDVNTFHDPRRGDMVQCAKY